MAPWDTSGRQGFTHRRSEDFEMKVMSIFASLVAFWECVPKKPRLVYIYVLTKIR